MAFVNLPPNLQDIFYSITDRIAKLETGPNQAMYTAEAAQGTASDASAQAANASAQALIAQTQATQALTQAQAAYVLGSQALIKDSNTITNSSNNLTGINANGITVYSGGSATTGARVVLNSAGIAGYNSSNNATFSVLASTGAVSTTGAIFTSSTISGGSLNINGNAVIDSSGFLTAQGATLKGTVNATAGYFGSPSDGWSIGAQGLIGVGAGYLSGGAINGSTITGGTVQTSTGAASVILNGASNAIQFKAASSVVANMVPLTLGGSVYGVLMHNGSTPDPSGNTYPQAYVGSGAAQIAYDSGTYVSCSVSSVTLRAIGGTISLANNTSANSQLNYPGIATGSGSTMVLVTTGSRVAYTTSSERFKQDIQYVSTGGWLDKVLSMRPITYKTNVDFVTEGEPNDTQIGFLAEDINDIGGGLEKTIIFDPLGDPFSLSYDRLTVFLTLAIKEIDARLKILEGK